MVDLTSAPVPAVRPDDHVRGDPATAVIMYADFTCPRCAVEAVALREAGTPVVFRHFALRARHPRALAVAHAAEAAALQDAFWAFHDALYDDQGRLDDVKVIFLSAVFDWQTYQKALRLGAKAWLVKGTVRLTDVVDRVADCLAQAS